MNILEILEQVRELVRTKGRVTYRVLKRQFNLADDYLEDIKAELIDAEHVAMDEDGKVLVWIGPSSLGSSVQSPESAQVQSLESRVQSPENQPLTPSTQRAGLPRIWLTASVQ